MSATTPNETIIRNIFDKFWAEVKFQGWEISSKIKTEIEMVEEDLVLDLEGFYSREEFRDELEAEYDNGYQGGYEDGQHDGYQVGYEEGHSDGYDQAIEDYKIEV